jgi:hypothetical protein
MRHGKEMRGLKAAASVAVAVAGLLVVTHEATACTAPELVAPCLRGQGEQEVRLTPTDPRPARAVPRVVQ